MYQIIISFSQSIFFLLLIVLNFNGLAQSDSNKSPGSIEWISEDSSVYAKMGLRIQSLYVGRQTLHNNTWEENFLIRRSRLKFDGYFLNPKIRYKFEFGLSNNDTRRISNFENGLTANFILDAVVKWEFAENWEFWVGQTKLPGNRERVISSQQMQFVDRSLVNAFFNLDRDIGVQVHHQSKINNFIVRQSFALSKGEGRNIIIANPNSGRELTLRLECLPFGYFTDGGDYFGSDLAREVKPKLSLGISGDFNSKAVRSRGNLGPFLSDTISAGSYLNSDLATLILDGVLKYRGLSVTSEYIYRDAPDRKDGFGYGKGFFGGVGYMITNKFELAGRYTQIKPISNLSSIRPIEEYTLGASYYIRQHNFKVQGDVSHRTISSQNRLAVFRIQCELAI